MDEAQPDYIISDLWPLIVGIDEVQIDPSNAMTHDEANLDQIAGSLNKHKQRKPIVINRATGTIEAGNGTLLAARRLGWQYIAAVGEEDDAQTAVSYGIADNAVASQAWDWERLKKHLDTFDAPGEVPGVDDGLLATLKEALAAEDLNSKKGDAPPQVDRAAELQLEYGTEVGQIWRLGEHRVACGDCTDRAVVEGVMGANDKIGLLTDPPYGVKRDEGFEGFGGFGTPIARKQYSGGWDKERPSQKTFNYFISIADEALIFGGNFFADILPLSTCWLVWDKLNTMPTFGDCELVWTNLNRKSVKKITFEYNGLIGKEIERFHATQKPLGLIVELMKEYTKAPLIFDPFLGSGTTLIACENLGRRCRGIEIDPGYAAVTLRRWEELTGEKAEKIENG